MRFRGDLRVPLPAARPDLSVSCLELEMGVDHDLLMKATATEFDVGLFSALWRHYARLGDVTPATSLVRQALENENLDVLKFLLTVGADLKTVDDDLRTLFFFLPNTSEALRLAEFLKGQGIELEAQDRYGETALLHAGSKLKEYAVWGLIAIGANLLARTTLRHTVFSLPGNLVPFMCSFPAACPMMKTFDLAVLSQCSPNQQHLFIHLKNTSAFPSLTQALEARDDWDFGVPDISGEPMFAVLVKDNRSVFQIVIDSVRKSAPNRAPALLPLAIAPSQVERIGDGVPPLERLISIIAKLSLPNWDDTSLSYANRTALHVACERNCSAAIFKLAKVANLSAVDDFGNTPLCLLMSQLTPISQATGIAQMLIHMSAEKMTSLLDLKNNTGENPLFLAVRANLRIAAAALITAGASLSDLGPSKMHLIHVIARYNAWEVFQDVKLRTDLGDMLSLCDDCGSTPIEVACKWQSVKTAALMLAAGANPNPTDGHVPEVTCLGIAAQHTEESSARSLIDLLLQHNADPAARDRSGRTPAEVCGHPSLRDRLIALTRGEESARYSAESNLREASGPDSALAFGNLMPAPSPTTAEAVKSPFSFSFDSKFAKFELPAFKHPSTDSAHQKPALTSTSFTFNFSFDPK
jgi:ankyrin repeat protein